MRTNFVAQKMVIKGYEIEVASLNKQLAIKQEALDDCATVSAQKDEIIHTGAQKLRKVKTQRNTLGIILGVMIVGLIIAK